MTYSDTTNGTDSYQLGRRALLRKGAGAGVLAVGSGTASSDLSPVRDIAAIDLGRLSRQAAAAAVAPFYYGAVGIEQLLASIVGHHGDLSGYIGADQLRTRSAIQAIEIAVGEENGLTSLSNNAQHSDTVAYGEGQTALLKTFEAGQTQSEANSAMETAVNEYYHKLEKNLWTIYETQVQRVLRIHDSLVTHSDTKPHNVFDLGSVNTNTSAPYIAAVDQNIRLADGSSKTVPILASVRSTNGELGTVWENIRIHDPRGSNGGLTETDYSDEFQNVTHSSSKSATHLGALSVNYAVNNINQSETDVNLEKIDTSSITVVDADAYRSVWQTLRNRRSTVISNLEGYVTDVYSQWDREDIPAEDLVPPTVAATNLRTNYEGRQAQGAYATFAGIPTSAPASLTIQLHDAGVTVKGDLYYSGSKTFEIGTKYDPATISEPIYIAYDITGTSNMTNDGTPGEVASGTDFTTLDQPFTIVKGTDTDGNNINTVETTSRTTHTADPSALMDQIEQLQQTVDDLQQSARDNVAGGGGGGGGGSGIGLGGIAALIGGGGVIAYIFTGGGSR